MDETSTRGTALLAAPPARTPTRPVALVALAGVAVFAALLALQSIFRGDRSPVRDFVSEYAVGTHGWVQTIAFVILGTAELALGSALWLASSGRRGLHVVAVLVGAGCLVDWTSALFEIDLDGAPTTTHGQVHDIAGMVGFLSLTIAMVILWLVGRRTPGWRGVARWSGAAALLMVVGFVAVGTAEPAGWGGLAQRYVIVVFLGWYAILARHLLSAPEEPRS